MLEAAPVLLQVSFCPLANAPLPVSVTQRKTRSHTEPQAAFRGERTRHRVVQPALAAFRDVCDRISADCPGLTAESLCGPIQLPRWLWPSADRGATVPAQDASIASSVGDGSPGCAQIGSADDGDAADDGAAATTASTTLLCATAPRDEEGAKGSDSKEELKRPPPRPATPPVPSAVGPVSVSVSVVSGCVQAPPPAFVSGGGRDTSEAVKQEEEGSGEEEATRGQDQGWEAPNLNTARIGNTGGVSDRFGAPHAGESTQLAVERHAVEGGAKSSIPPADEIKQEAFRYRRQHSMESSDGDEEGAPPAHAIPFCSDGETVRQASCDELPAENGVVVAGGSTLMASGSVTDADVDCFAYSDGEDGGFPTAPGGNSVVDDPALLSPRLNNSPASSSPPPPRPTSPVAGVVVFSSSDRSQGNGGSNIRDPGDDGDASWHQSRGSSWKGSSGGVEESGGDETGEVVDGKRENNEPPAGEDGGEGKGALVDSRVEGDAIITCARAASRQDTAKAAASREREERRGTGERKRARGGRRRSSADVLAHAYAAYSSPTRDTSNLFGRGQIRANDLGRSLTGSVASSFDASPLKGESIPTLAFAATRKSSDTGYSDGVGVAGADLLAAAKAVVSGEGTVAGGAVGQDVSQPFSAWRDGDRRLGHSKAAPSLSSDVERRTSGGRSAHDSHRRPEPTLENSAHDIDARQKNRCGEEDGGEGKRAASIADWSSLELEEELCRVREAIESRVQVSPCGRPLSWRGWEFRSRLE